MHTENADLRTFCSLFYSATNIPVTVFDKKGEKKEGFPSDFLERLPFFLSDVRQNPFFKTSESGGFYGLIIPPESTDFLCVGPCYNVKPNEEILHSFLKEQMLSRERRDAVFAALQRTPTMNNTSFLRQLCFLFFCLNHRAIDINRHFHLTDTSDFVRQHSKSLQQAGKNKEQRFSHNTFYLEQQLYDCIRSGNMDGLIRLFQREETSGQLTEGVMADNPLRQCKNIFIGTVTKIGVLAAIPGGLDIEQTYQLIDHYALECEKMSSISDIMALHYTAATDFCQRVAGNKIPEDLSSDLYVCISYIRNHTNESIRVADVAEHIHRSPSYVTKKFKDTLGINVGSFITRCKLEEAKSLLAYSKKSLSEISSYLCFSSQSYFQNVFKKKYGVTPLQYRKRHHTLNYYARD